MAPNPPLKFKSVFLYIYQKLFTKCDMKACHINSGIWVSQESFISFLETIFQVDSKGLFQTDKRRRGDQF